MTRPIGCVPGGTTIAGLACWAGFFLTGPFFVFAAGRLVGFFLAGRFLAADRRAGLFLTGFFLATFFLAGFFLTVFFFEAFLADFLFAPLRLRFRAAIDHSSPT